MSTRDLLRANDERFRALAGEFSADEWSQPSLCDGWTNHDVLAHLVVGCSAGATAVTAEILRHGGSFDRANTSRPASSMPTSRRRSSTSSRDQRSTASVSGFGGQASAV